MEKTLNELLRDLRDQEHLRYEGEVGVQSLERIATILGYGDGGDVIRNFLVDNSGAIQALVKWLGDQNLPEWRESVEGELVDEGVTEDADFETTPHRDPIEKQGDEADRFWYQTGSANVDHVTGEREGSD